MALLFRTSLLKAGVLWQVSSSVKAVSCCSTVEKFALVRKAFFVERMSQQDIDSSFNLKERSIEKRLFHCIDGENLEDQHLGNDMAHFTDTSGSSSTRDTDLSNLSEKVEKVTKPQKKIPWTEVERAAVHSIWDSSFHLENFQENLKLK